MTKEWMRSYLVEEMSVVLSKLDWRTRPERAAIVTEFTDYIFMTDEKKPICYTLKRFTDSFGVQHTVVMVTVFTHEEHVILFQHEYHGKVYPTYVANDIYKELDAYLPYLY